MASTNLYSWLLKRGQFLLVASSGRRWTSPTLMVQFKPIEDDSTAFGLTVSKKVGNAVRRTRVKRQLRAAIADVFPALTLHHGHYVIVARQAAWPANYTELCKDLRWCLTRVQTVQAKPYQPKRKNKSPKQSKTPERPVKNDAPSIA